MIGLCRPKLLNTSEINKNLLFVSLVLLFGNVEKNLPVPILHKLGGRALEKIVIPMLN